MFILKNFVSRNQSHCMWCCIDCMVLRLNCTVSVHVLLYTVQYWCTHWLSNGTCTKVISICKHYEETPLWFQNRYWLINIVEKSNVSGSNFLLPLIILGFCFRLIQANLFIYWFLVCITGIRTFSPQNKHAAFIRIWG